MSGLGFSHNGYNGPYEIAITADGQIVADFITSGSLVANIIKAGVIQSQDGSSYWDLESVSHCDEMGCYNGKIVFDGIVNCAKACLTVGIPVGLDALRELDMVITRRQCINAPKVKKMEQVERKFDQF